GGEESEPPGLLDENASAPRESTRQLTPDAGEASEGPTAVYLYAVLDAETKDPTTLSRGIDPSRPAELVSAAGLVAAVSRVDQDFVESEVRHPDRLADLARRHDDVISQLGTPGPAVPFRLGTMCAAMED